MNSQVSLTDQLRAAVRLCNQNGLYDAADHLERLKDENKRLREVLGRAVYDHANDEDYPCEACKWTLEEWPLLQDRH